MTASLLFSTLSEDGISLT